MQCKWDRRGLVQEHEQDSPARYLVFLGVFFNETVVAFWGKDVARAEMRFFLYYMRCAWGAYACSFVHANFMYVCKLNNYQYKSLDIQAPRSSVDYRG
jgi:hypothetical protein